MIDNDNVFFPVSAFTGNTDPTFTVKPDREESATQGLQKTLTCVASGK